MRKQAIVTGAARGIGRAALQAFAQAGWEVLGLDLLEAPSGSPSFKLERVDLSDAGAVEAFFDRLGRDWKRLDALVNNAAISLFKPLLETAPEEWDRIQATNLRSVYWASRCAFPLLRAAGGAIVNISSVHALATSINVAAYAASKGGIQALTRAMALEFGPHGIRVNAILPGAVDTQMLREGMERGHLAASTPEQRMEELGHRTVLGRVGKSDEIAQAILFLADARRSSFITGHGLVVDGGASARLSTE